MIPKEIISMCLQFMQRVNLKGAEVDAYITVVQTLQGALREPESPPSEATGENT
jgi:hypothetical protein